MRYNVNQSVRFIRFIVTGTHPMDIELQSPVASISPWLNNGAKNKVEIKTLTCAEHHKVADEFMPDGEKKYDGFIFKEQGNNLVWHNQFPTASYGQTSDEGNRIVSTAIFSKDGKSIEDILEFYDLASAFESMIKAYKSKSLNKWAKLQLESIFKQIDDIMSEQGIGFIMDKRDFGKCTMISYDVVHHAQRGKKTAMECLAEKWEDNWL